MSNVEGKTSGNSLRDSIFLVRYSSFAFTLMEVLVVLGIMGMISLIVMSITPFGARDQACYDATIEIMDRIERALLGVKPTHLQGERRYMGYIADMGELPDLLGEAMQPAGLWTDRLSGLGAESDLPSWRYTGPETRQWVGWHGPYLGAPAGSLRDGWGNPLIFERFDITPEGVENANPKGVNLRFKSLGSDGLPQDGRNPQTGYAADIERVIREQDYLGSLAGFMNTDVNVVVLYFPSKGQLRSITFSRPPGEDGYFFTSPSSLLPLGTRSLRTMGAVEKTLLFSIEPTANFLGTIP